jgi:hypothetical protein
LQYAAAPTAAAPVSATAVIAFDVVVNTICTRYQDDLLH